MKVTALAGGVGGSKMLAGLARIDIDLTAIINTGDDDVIYGVHVSPDVDICTYRLAGLLDRTRGWGLEGDTFDVLDALGRLGTETWFRLGDRDLATCVFRTQRLAEGHTLSTVTDEVRRALGVTATLIPMSDDPVRTRIVTADGRTLDFQEYFVKEKQEPEVADVRYAGIADAKPAPGVIEAIRSADVVVICPSNPVVSIGPILALPDIRDALVDHPKVVAVTPIVRGAPLRGPADRLLKAVGVEVSAGGVASMYEDFVDTFVVDRTDEVEADLIEGRGVRTLVTDTIMKDDDGSERLARTLL